MAPTNELFLMVVIFPRKNSPALDIWAARVLKILPKKPRAALGFLTKNRYSNN